MLTRKSMDHERAHERPDERDAEHQRGAAGQGVRPPTHGSRALPRALGRRARHWRAAAVVGRWFFLGLSLVSALGTALVFWAGGHLVLRGAFSVGTIVAFSAYLANLYGPLMALTNARVDFATSMVSFERVFEVLDLPAEIHDGPGALDLARVEGTCCNSRTCRSPIARRASGAGRARSGAPLHPARRRSTTCRQSAPRTEAPGGAVAEARRARYTLRGTQLRDPSRPGGGAGRPERRRQDDGHLPGAAAIRSDRAARSCWTGTTCAA